MSTTVPATEAPAFITISTPVTGLSATVTWARPAACSRSSAASVCVPAGIASIVNLPVASLIDGFAARSSSNQMPAG